MAMENNGAAASNRKMKLFEGEKWLVLIGLLGFALAAFAGVYVLRYGAVVLPEGDVSRAFSFDAAIGIFAISIAAILPLASLSPRARKRFRLFYAASLLYGYAVETIQHFRGINPRFTKVGTVGDSIAGGLFGLEAILIVVVTLLLAAAYFRPRQPHERPLVALGIRYAFLSLLFAFAAGTWMIIMQSRYTGMSGNLIVLHGLSFHALQALPLLGWLPERALTGVKTARLRLHIGGIAWMAAMALLFVQTALGHTVFEWTALPVAAGVMLAVWLGTAIAAAAELLKPAAAQSDAGFRR
ncbi:hypothetical protein [Paenibacillus humicola]|uniref:hypothetical protein n=1 Tax=Paenibacillus humicola TaxID=3110540 RepID=UPI00237C4102|nr:hypothetical protein [Paenibacillus humicola]